MGKINEKIDFLSINPLAIKFEYYKGELNQIKIGVYNRLTVESQITQ